MQKNYRIGSIVNIRGFGGVQKLPDIHGNRKPYIGSSFVAPLISLKIAQILKENKLSFEEILKKLKEDAVRVQRSCQLEVRKQVPLDIKQAILFPVNKEIKNILRYPELLCFQIKAVYDFRHMRIVNKNISSVIGKKVSPDFVVKDIRNIDWDDDFDTVIMGHMEEINQALHFNYTEWFIEQARIHGKRIYSFDPLLKYADAEDVDFIYIDKSYVPENRFGKQYQFHCPVIGIFGTSSKQGKFTLQLELRKRFINNNYNIVQLSKESSGLLYGMDAVYPMGYGGNVGITSYDEIMAINNMAAQIVKDDTDLLLFGSQSQTVAYSSQNTALYALGNVDLLLATFPDIVILCVNCYDDNEYIVRTIRFLEGIVDTKVIGIAISPFQKEYSGSSMLRNFYLESEEVLSERLIEIQDLTGIRVFRLSDEKSIDEMWNLCIETLS